MFKVNIPKNLLLLIMSTLMLTTVFMPFGLPADFGPIIIGFVWLFLCMLYFCHVPFPPIVDGYKVLLFIIITSVALGMIKVLFADVMDLENYLKKLILNSAPKILYLFFIYFLVSRLDRDLITKVFINFNYLLIFTLVLSLIIYEIFPIERFVWYHRETRFAGFHYELVNFSFSCFVSGIVFLFLYFKKNLLIYSGIIILTYLINKVSVSNYVPIFFGSIVFSLFLIKLPKQVRSMVYLSYFLVLISFIIFLPFILGFISELMFLFPRVTPVMNATNPVYVRLFQHVFAMHFFYENIFSLPNGFYIVPSDAQLKSPVLISLSEQYRYFEHKMYLSKSGGQGLSRLFMEFGLLIVPFLILLVFTFLKILKKMDFSNKKDQMYFILINLCFAYSYLQAGFFNFTVIAVFLLSLRYWRII